MAGLVALHTQLLHEPEASTYLDVLARSLRAARLSNAFPDRRRFDATLRALAAAGLSVSAPATALRSATCRR